MRPKLIPDKPREIVKPGRVVVTLQKKKTKPIVHTAPRAAIRIEKNGSKGTLVVVSLDERGKVIRILATYKPSEWKKAKVHRPVLKPRPEIKEEYKRQQAVAAAMLMTETFGQNWNPHKIH